MLRDIFVKNPLIRETKSDTDHNNSQCFPIVVASEQCLKNLKRLSRNLSINYLKFRRLLFFSWTAFTVLYSVPIFLFL